MEHHSSPAAVHDPLTHEFIRIVAENFNGLDEAHINGFVDLGESMGLSRDAAMEVIVDLVNRHLEEAEAQGLEIQWEPNPAEHREQGDVQDPLTDATLSCESEPNPPSEAYGLIPLGPPAPVRVLAEPPASAPSPPAPAQVPSARSSGDASFPPIAHAVDTPAPRPTRVVRLGRRPVFEQETAVVTAERSAFPDFTNPAGMEMRLIPSGTFLLGCEDADAPKNERPCVQATMTCFYMARFPVTNIQYEQFAPGHGAKRLPSTGGDHPVVFVSSMEAVKFCEWLTRMDKGHRYRLPTEAEWEYAARGTTRRRYPWGHEEDISTVANFADARSRLAWRNEDLDDGFPDTSPVGSFPDGASPFRIEDMAGNVWEWCLDFYDSYRTIPRTNPRGPTIGTNRVTRGGSYKSRFSSLRTTTRGFSLPNCAANDIGFRVVCEAA